MTLSEILGADRVLCGVSFTSKKKALEALARLLSHGQPSASVTDILASLAGREKLGSTGLGRGIAIPHGRLSGVTESVGAVLRLQQPIDYDAQDGQPVDLLFGLLVPQDASETHLKHLAAIAEMFSDEPFCAKLRATEDAAALFTLVARYAPSA